MATKTKKNALDGIQAPAPWAKGGMLWQAHGRQRLRFLPHTVPW